MRCTVAQLVLDRPLSELTGVNNANSYGAALSTLIKQSYKAGSYLLVYASTKDESLNRTLLRSPPTRSKAGIGAGFPIFGIVDTGAQSSQGMMFIACVVAAAAALAALGMLLRDDVAAIDRTIRETAGASTPEA